MINRQKIIQERPPIDFAKMKVGLKQIDDILIDTIVENKKKSSIRNNFENRVTILNAIAENDVALQRQISDYWYNHSGIYKRLCKYMAYMYKYDWFILPHYSKQKKDQIEEMENTSELEDDFFDVLDYLDDFQLKRFFGETALKVVRHGVFYGYLIMSKGKVSVQELPPNYCRSRFKTANYRPVVEFNMRFFDDRYTDAKLRMRVLKAFPPEFLEGYRKYKAGKLIGDFPGDTAGWFTLDPRCTVKFNMNGEDFPLFISVIPALIDLQDADELNKLKLQQQLLKIIIQKMPLDKNGDMIFDMDEMAEMHKNAVVMLGRTIGIDVLTTLADVDVADLAKNVASDSADEVKLIKDAAYDAAGVSQMQFNTDGNIALQYSTLNDAASMLPLIQQFQEFINILLTPFNKRKAVKYKGQILETTIYNYQEMSKYFKEHTQIGYSKFLPQIAMGLSQSTILASALFENEVLNLVEVFIPPMSSNTMNAETLANVSSRNKRKGGDTDLTGEEGAGRPEKDDTEKSEKTIQNRESMA